MFVTSFITVLSVRLTDLSMCVNSISKTVHVVFDPIFQEFVFKVHLDPPPILVQSSQKLQDNGTKKSQNILFGKKLLIYEFFRFLVSFYFSALKYFENTLMARITPGRP